MEREIFQEGLLTDSKTSIMLNPTPSLRLKTSIKILVHNIYSKDGGNSSESFVRWQFSTAPKAAGTKLKMSFTSGQGHGKSHVYI